MNGQVFAVARELGDALLSSGLDQRRRQLDPVELRERLGRALSVSADCIATGTGSVAVLAEQRPEVAEVLLAEADQRDGEGAAGAGGDDQDPGPSKGQTSSP